MGAFIFTFGQNEKFPFQNGWVEIIAQDLISAEVKFDNTFGKQEGSFCSRYAFSYKKEDFVKTDMHTKGNFGGFCHLKFG